MIKIIAAMKSDLQTEIRNKNRAEANLCDNFCKHFGMAANSSAALRKICDSVRKTPSRFKKLEMVDYGFKIASLPF